MISQLSTLYLIISVIAVSFSQHAEGALVQRSEKCIRKTKNSVQNYNDDLDESLLQLQKRSPGAKLWRGKKILYKIENMPECSDDLTEEDVRKLIDTAAEQWNNIPHANVLLVNVDTLEKEDESPNIDIHISFQPCKHKIPALKFDSDFDPCDGQYGHAIHFGDMHLNTYMTWTDKTELHEKEIQENELVMPNLYTIVLHEFGHCLGLSHSQYPEEVMFALFGGDRKHRALTLGMEDVSRIQELYPPTLSCRDKTALCATKGPSVCQVEAQRRVCPRTCDDCTCDADTPDDYLKCTPDLCSTDLRQFCQKTCKLCVKQCSGPPVVLKITSSAKFPVDAGTKVTVGCETGHELEGDTVLTCVDGNEYSFKTQPFCVEEEEEGPEELIECSDKSPKKCAKKLRQGKKCSSKWMKKNCKETCNRCPTT